MIFIVDQVYVFLYSILGGAIAAFFYDILRIKRRAVKTNILLVGLEDIIYWLVAAVFLFITVYKSNSGEMRGYIFLGNIIGVMLYESLLSKMIIDLSVTFISIIKKAVAFIAKILSYPFIFIYKVFKPVITLTAKLITRVFKAIMGRIGKINGKIDCFTKKKVSSIKKKLRKVRKNT